MRRPMGPTPGLLRRAWVPPLIVFIATVAYSAGLMALVLPGTARLVIAWITGAVLILCAPIPILAARYRSRRARARAFWYRICPHCGADLRLVGDEGACPSCARPHTRAALLKHWEGTDEKSARAKRWRPLSARGVLSPMFMMGLLPMAAGLLLAMVIVSLGLVPRAMAPIALGITGPMFALFGPSILKRDRRDFAMIEQGRFCTCPECLGALPVLAGSGGEGAPVDGVEAQACCASCGERYSMPWLEETWKLSYAHIGAVGKGHAVWQPDRGSRRIAIVMGLALMGVALAFWFLRGVAPWISSPLVIGIGMAIVVIVALGCVGMVAVRSGYHHSRMIALRAQGYRFCPECGYDLRDSATEGPCPECGVAYSPESLQKRWEREPKVDPPAL